MKPRTANRILATAFEARVRGAVRSSVQILALAGLLTACGGGGGGGSSPATGGQSAVQASPQETPVSTSLDDLVVDPGFNLQATFTLDVDVQLNQSKRAYFSLCDQYRQSDSGISVDFESCLFRGALDAGALSQSLQVANHSRELMAVIWFYDGSAPIYQQWQYADAETDQQLLIN